MNTKEIGKLCKQLRENAGLSQADLAAMLDLPKVRISDLELGKVRIREYEQKSYASLFNISRRQLECDPIPTVIKYDIVDAISALREELGEDRLNQKDICEKTGIPRWKIRNLFNPTTKVYASKEEVDLLAGYFGKDASFFMNKPVEVQVRGGKKEEPKVEEKKENAVTVSAINDTKDDDIWLRKVQTELNWRDKAHELHRELRKVQTELDNWKRGLTQTSATNDKYESMCLDYDKLFSDHQKLSSDYEALKIECEELKSNNDAWENTVDNLKAELDHEKELSNALREAYEKKFKELKKKEYEALKAECDEYKNFIVKVVLKFGNEMLDEL